MHNIHLLNEVDRELRAYIYQQLAVLQPYLAKEAIVGVIVKDLNPHASTKMITEQAYSEDHDEIEAELLAEEQDLKAHQRKGLLVTLTVNLGAGNLRSSGHAEDIYTAFSKAKQGLILQLTQWHNATMNPLERAIEVEGVLSGNYIIH